MICDVVPRHSLPGRVRSVRVLLRSTSLRRPGKKLVGTRDKDKGDIQGGEGQGGEGQGGGKGQGQERQHEEDEEEDKEEKPDKDEKDICEDYSDKRPMKLVVEYIFIDY